MSLINRLVLCLVVAFFAIGVARGQVNENDSIALIRLFEATDGFNWNTNTYWLSNRPITDWYGVNVVNNRVTNISLGSNNLTGALPPEMNNLTDLQELYLYNNNLTGTLPDLSALTQLQNCNLRLNYLQGGLSSFVNSPALTSLNVRENQFSFTDLIAAYTAMTNKLGYWSTSYYQYQRMLGKELHYPYAASATYTFTLGEYNQHPDDVIQWYKNGIAIPGATNDTLIIQNASPDDQGFYNCIVTNINLSNVTLESNLMSIGKETIEMEEKAALVSFYNALNGSSWQNKNNWLTDRPLDEWYGISVEYGRVSQISLSNNNLQGEIPPEIANLKGLTYLYLSNNGISGSLPDMSALVALEFIRLDGNKISGGLNSLTGIPGLTGVYVYDNQLDYTDLIPVFLSNSVQWNWIYNSSRYSNQTLGEPTDFTYSSGMDYSLTPTNYTAHSSDSLQWYKDGQAITGANSVTLDITNANENDIAFYYMAVTNQMAQDSGMNVQVQSNTFSIGGDLIAQSERDALVAFYNSTNGDGWTRNDNWLSSKPLEDWYGVTVQNDRVYQIQLVNNNLVGELPAELTNLKGLYKLALAENHLMGELPDMSNLLNLEFLGLRDNRLTGGLSTVIGLPKLQKLNVSSNSFGFGELIPAKATNKWYWLYGIDYYSPQVFGKEADYAFEAGMTYLFSAGNYIAHPDDSIQWYHEGRVISEANDTILTISNAATTDIGNYTFKVFNTNLTTLEIQNPLMVIGADQIRPIERQILVDFYNATGGGGWNNNSNWLSDEPIENWYGVYTENGRVVDISLSNNNLKGTIPEGFGELTFLRSIELYNNELEGDLPDFSYCNDLSYINIRNNNFTGGLDYLINLQNLSNVYISNNRFSFADIVPLYNALNSRIYWSNSGNYSPQQLGSSMDYPFVAGNSYNLAVSGYEMLAGDSIQWYKDEVAISGTNSQSYSVSNATESDIGTYYYRVLNPAISNLVLVGEPLTIGGESIEQMERDALIALYDSTQGDDWYNNDNWKSNLPLSEWYGVEMQNGRVSALYLSSNRLIGSIPSALADLKLLRSLELQYNQLSGDIPDLSALSMLNYAYLYNNYLSGGVAALANLPALFTLYVSNNLFDFTELVPASQNMVNKLGYEWYSYYYSPQRTLGKPQIHLYGAGNTYQFTYGDALGTQAEDSIQWYKDDNPIEGANALTLTISNAQEGDTGVYHMQIYNKVLTSVTLETSDIQIVGSERYGVMEVLLALYDATNGELWYNKGNWFTGEPLNNWYGISTTNGQITQINLSGNNLDGPLPPELSTLTSLQTLNLSNNKLTGGIPASYADLTNLVTLYLYNNDLSGDIPDLSALPVLRDVYIYNNYFTGGLDYLANLADIYSYNFYVYDNLFPMSELSAAYSTLVTTRGYYWSDYNYSPQRNFGIEQDLPYVEGSNYTLDPNGYVASTGDVLQWFKDGTEITGANSATLQVNNASIADLGFYHLKVTHPDVPNAVWESNTISIGGEDIKQLERQALIALYDSTNGNGWYYHYNWLTNAPLEDWYGISIENGRVSEISLGNNNLYGVLPPELKDLFGLKYLYLYNNKLSGSLLNELGDLPSLTELYLYGNQFSGAIPYWPNSNLTYVYLDDNNLGSGLANLFRLKNLTSGYNIYAENNRFNFVELIASRDTASARGINWYSYNFSPQKNLGEEIDYPYVAGSDYVLDIAGYVSHADDQFQWYKDGNLMTGETSRTLNITNATTDDIGFYHCIVSNTNLTGITLQSNLQSIGGDVIEAMERQALIAFYDATNGVNWDYDSNWKSSAPLDEWYGITVENGRVTRINLSSNNLTGTLPAELDNLTGLTRLYLSSNNLQGDLPEMMDLTKLAYCYIYDNNFTGGLKDLLRIPGIDPYYYYVHQNKFQFDELAPAVDTVLVNGKNWPTNRYQEQQKLGAPQDLEYVEGQKYTFTLTDYRPEPDDLIQWYKDGVPITGANATTLILNSATSSSMGYYVCKITNSHVANVTLESYPISLGGTEIEQLERDALVALYQSTQGSGWNNSYNWLSDNPIADWYGVVVENGRVTQLDLGNNNLNGPLPEELNNLNALDRLYFNDNNIAGTIPDVSGLKVLRYAYLYRNSITGGVENFASLNNIIYLNVFNNNLTFNSLIPAYNAMMANTGSWSSGYYSPQNKLGESVAYDFVLGNNYTFSIGEVDSHESDQLQWYKDGQMLVGENNPILLVENAQPSDRGFYYCTITNSNLSSLTLQSEIMSIGGDEVENLEREALIALFNATDGLNWNNRNYWLSNRPLNDWSGITTTNGRVTQISLTYNNLVGSLPAELNNLTALQRIYLNNNVLSGSLPDLSSLTNLIQVYVSQNNLDGGLVSLADLPNLTDLDVDNNRFTYIDLVPAKDSLASHGVSWYYYYYYPQKNVGEARKYLYTEGDNYVFVANDYKARPDDTYQWYKNGGAISGATDSVFVIASAVATDRATYTYRVLNPGFSGMQLVSNNIELAGLAGYEILDFTISGQVGATEIDQQNFTVRVTMPFGTDLTNLSPVITIPDGSFIDPPSDQAINFISPVTYTVTNSTSTSQDWIVTVITEHEGARCASPIAYGPINSPAQSGYLINGKYYWYEFTLPATYKLVDINTNGSAFDTRLALFSSCPDVSTDPNNLSGALRYDDDSGEGRASRILLDSLVAGTYRAVVYAYSYYGGNYNISITGIPPNASHETEILAVTIPQADSVKVVSAESTVWIYMPYATDVSSLVPDITLSAGAKVNPASNTAQSFADPVTYTVTAEDGYTMQPWIFKVYQGTGQQERALPSGWSWISFNLENDDMGVNNMLSSINAVEADYLKTNLASSRYYDGYGWFGDLLEVGNDKMYMTYVASTDNLQISGRLVNPVNSNIPIEKGWNWIAYTPQVDIPINETFTGFGFSTNDYVKSQVQSAVYFEGFGWMGELTTMQPLHGYMFNSSATGMLNYAVPANYKAAKLTAQDPTAALDEQYGLNRNEFEFSAGILCMVTDESGRDVVSDGDVLVISDIRGKVLGVSRAVYVPPFNRYQFMALAYTNEDYQEVGFSLIKANTQEVCEITNKVGYQADDILGTGTDPIVLITTATVDVEDIADSQFAVYPNPASNEIWITAPVRITNLSIFNTEGKMVLNKVVENTQCHLSLEGLAPGIYHFRINTATGVKVEKVVLR